MKPASYVDRLKAIHIKGSELAKSPSISETFKTASTHNIERALDHTLEHFRAIVQCSDDAIISKTLDGVVTSWNSGAQSIFGYTEQEMLGKPMLTIFPPDRLDEEAYILQQIVSGTRVDHFETERLHKNGNRIKVSVTISPIRDRNGVVIGASKIARDITQRVKLEAEARIANAILQSTDDAVVGESLHGVVTSWNPGASRIYGYSSNEMVGHPIQLLIPPERQGEQVEILEKIRNGETIDHFETVRVRKDGKRINVSVTVSPIRDRWGHVIGASKIARDITLQKASEAQLRLTSSVFTATSEGILIAHSDGLIADVNQAFTRITGYARDEVLGKNPQDFRSGRQSPKVFRSMRRALMRSGEWQGEIWSRRKDGEAYTVLLTVSRVCDTTGSVCNYVALFTDITPLKRQQEQLEYGAHFDSLTKLPNRLLLSDRLHQAMVNCQRKQKLLAVLYMDIDGFKSINDNFGHGAGDELLIAISQQMRVVLREGDTLARMGGDEFVVVLTDFDNLQDCVQLVHRLLAACSKPVDVNGNTLSVTASIGVTLYPNDDVDADLLMRHADNAMYEAKRNGKNRLHMFDAVQDAELKHRSVQQYRIEQALNSNEFVLHYQPKINMRTGEVIGAEALVRWQHPDHGLLHPAAFLPLIEKHPLCEMLGTWVLEATLQQMDLWSCSGIELPVSINVSARQLQDVNFVAKLTDVLERHPQVTPSHVELEILETSALEDMAFVQKIMHECQAVGVHFTLDDFGTGYSSLTYLARLQVATLKIDQSFVRDMLADPGNLSIVKGVIGLAQAFNRRVIAEGVETPEQVAALLGMGCDLGQGYVIAKPMPAELLPEWISSWKAPVEWGASGLATI